MKVLNTDTTIASLKLKNTDGFFALNLFLFLWMCKFAYYQRFTEYRGPGNVDEFFVYASLIIVALAAGWWYFRRFSFPNYILVFLQLGILIHFIGGFVPADGNRLYDSYLLGVRFDKFVHFLNAFIAAVIINYLFKIFNVRLPYIRSLVILMFVLGLGATIEIIEYLVLLTIPDTGVGGYHNNMQDLLANFTGCMVYISKYKIRKLIF